jgi:uncharacterized protein (DUF2147 family)
MVFKVALRAVLAALTLAAGASWATAADDPSGTWLTQDRRARIRIERCGPGGAQLCGYVVWLREAVTEGGQPRADAQNPDAGKRTRPLLGHQLLLGLAPEANGRYAGQIYNSEDGKKYDVTVWTETPGQLQVRGCLIAFLCSTQSWRAANDTLPGQLAAATGTPGGPRPDPEWATAATGTAKREPAKTAPAKPKS